MTELNASGLCLVRASAGSGKTTRLTREVVESLDPTAPHPIAVEGLFAVTYTTKAHAELASRLRRTLIERGEVERAERLPLASVGTVHAVCLGLVQEFALELGISPRLDGMPAEAARHSLQQSLEQGLSPELRARIEQLSHQLELGYDGRTNLVDWVTPVDRIMTLARNNRIPPDALAAMASRSSQGLLELLDPPHPDANTLDQELDGAIEQALDALRALDSKVKKTQGAIEKLEDARRRGASRLPFSRWAALTKLEPEKPACPLVEPVRRAAERHLEHPRLHAWIRELCEALFEAAAVGLRAYAEFKAERGLVDYVDMIDLALEALDVPLVSQTLADRIELLVVDEFQDTSPIQLALFSRLHGLCRRATWVGDQKQCIFEYAGADPTLLDAVARWVERAGGRTETLPRNHRSRPELVEPINACFHRAFAACGTEVGLDTEPARPSLPGLASLPAFGLAYVDGRKGREAASLAEQVARLLASPEATPVLDRTADTLRPLRPSDVAVLVATNREAERLAAALAERGIASVLPRTGLMDTPEATLIEAALRFLLDSGNSLARAELEALLGFDGGTGEQWLGTRIRQVQSDSPPPLPATLVALEALRPQLGTWAPSELVSHVIATLDVATLAQRWPSRDRHLDNLDAILALALGYENRAAYLREAASVAGLLRYFDEAREKIRQEDEERARDEQHVTEGAAAVVLSTYHKAKGLEWPVVVLGSLDREAQRSVFDVGPEADVEDFDPLEPLRGRWIRYWPWPLGRQEKTSLLARGEQSETGRRLAHRERRERIRLLYVGFTRARDHLVLAIPNDAKGKAKTAWLDELADERGPLLELPMEGAPNPMLAIRVGAELPLRVPVRIASTASPAAPSVADAPARRWFARTSRPEAVEYWVQPSAAAAAGLELPAVELAEPVRFGRRVALLERTTASWDEVGTALHAFLAADGPDLTRTARRDLALRISTRAGFERLFEPEALLEASDALRAFLAERFPDAKWQREVPISALLPTPRGPRRIRGSIDLLLHTSDGVVVVDHKSFPGASKEWPSKALLHAPQLLAYCQALRSAGHRVAGCFVHFTIGGGVVELREVGSAAAGA